MSGEDRRVDRVTLTAQRNVLARQVGEQVLEIAALRERLRQLPAAASCKRECRNALECWERTRHNLGGAAVKRSTV